MVFFRRDLIKVIKPFLKSNFSIENIPFLCKKIQFIRFLEQNGIFIEKNENKDNDDHQFITFIQQWGINVEKEGENKNKEEENKNKEEEEEYDQQIYIKQIIEEDKVELLQKETEKENNMNIIIYDSFLGFEDMIIPILHYCIMKKAIKCFKFLILNGANPSLKLSSHLDNEYEWDCMAVGAYFGEIEIMRILEERRMNKMNNPDVWEAVTLSHRNQFLHLFISRKDEIPNFEECLRKGLEGTIKGNNLKGFKLLISKGADINARDIKGI